MNLEEFKKIFLNECNRNYIHVDEGTIPLFYQYMIQILEWNKKVNVTAIKEEKEFIVKHFIDSLTINQYIQKQDKIIDIGTGAGFPGIPLKIANEDNEITLIDSVNKKLNVIRDAIKEMNLNHLQIMHIRAEDMGNQKDYREKFDVSTTRAVSHLSTIVEYMLPLLRVGGKAICMKGLNVEQEIEESKRAIELLGGKIEKVETIFISEEYERNIIVIKKIKSTPNKYPRKSGKPLKEPIR